MRFWAREADPAADGGAGGNRRRNNGRPRVRFDDALRADLKQEADSYFGYVTRSDRSVLELIDSDYTFLNARLAQYYGLGDTAVTGDAFRKVTLPSDSPRGGMLTMASVLAVTSNPTRTSPVKRGLFILDNILGAPAPPPPPNIPPLEAAAAGLKNAHPTLREVLAVHRSKPECVSCHQRLDPPGLALENFNAMGIWREREFGQPIEPGGTLVTGESFKNVREMKHILATRHSTEFYRCLTEKLLTYALGRRPGRLRRRGRGPHRVSAGTGQGPFLDPAYGRYRVRALPEVPRSADTRRRRSRPCASCAGRKERAGQITLITEQVCMKSESNRTYWIDIKISPSCAGRIASYKSRPLIRVHLRLFAAILNPAIDKVKRREQHIRSGESTGHER